MGLDINIYKRPRGPKEEVAYYRNNWVLQSWIKAKNCVDKIITVELMEELLDWIDNNFGSNDLKYAEDWDESNWQDFKDSVESIIKDMKANETYEYTYFSWW
jgi:hypothetical protein